MKSLCILLVIHLSLAVSERARPYYEANEDSGSSLMEKILEAQQGCNETELFNSVRVDLKHDIWKQLVHIGRDIDAALHGSHNKEAIKNLKESYHILEEIMEYLDAPIRPLDGEDFKQKPKDKDSVCADVYKTEKNRYYDINIGSNKAACSEVFSIIVKIVGIYNEAKSISLLKDIAMNYPLSTVYIAANHQMNVSIVPNLHVNVYTNLTNLSSGEIWNFLVSKAKTPYVFIAHDIDTLTNHSQLEILAYESSHLYADIVGGALKTTTGEWGLGCHKINMKNYTLSYQAYEDFALHGCVYCDDVSSPFIARTDFLKTFPFSEHVPTEILFKDYFLKLFTAEKHSIVCPTSMFHVTHDEKVFKNTAVWKQLAEKQNLQHIRLPNQVQIDLPCSNETKCEKIKGIGMSPCCMKHLTDMIKFIMKTCEEENILCELQEGTLLGAVKLNKVLPWEQDADITFLSANYSALSNLRTKFRAAGYQLSEGGELWCCVDERIAGGKFIVTTPAGWHVELYGQHYMDSERLISQGLQPTKVLLDGEWVNAPANPGLYVRNRYGYEVYKHAQHWMSTGSESGWKTYRPSTFSKCPKSKHHTCLDQYSIDGNIQFQESK